jgi:exosortase
MAVILAGGRDYGRCPLASRLPPALWPVGDGTAIERLLLHLSGDGIKQATICSDGDAPLLQSSITNINSMRLEFLNEQLPAGTAGCIRDAAAGEIDSLFLVFNASIILPPATDELLQAHHRGKSAMTVMFDPPIGNGKPKSHMSETYICEPEVLEYILPEGYCDIKEGLIPAMVRAGKAVHAAELSRSVGNFRDRAGYLAAIAGCLESNSNLNIDFTHCEWNGSKNVWLADSAKVASDSRIYGPVIIMDDAVISERAIIFGPTLLGRNVTVGKGALIENSVFWDGSRIGQNCEVHRCLVDYNAKVQDNRIIEDKTVIWIQNYRPVTKLNHIVSSVSNKVYKIYSMPKPLTSRIDAKLPAWIQSEKSKSVVLQWLGIGTLAGVFLWSYWQSVTELWNIWRRSDEYSSGLLVPFLALYILWTRRRKIALISVSPSIWGLVGFLAAQALRYFGLFFMYSSAERLSLVLSIASLSLLLFGRQIFMEIYPVLLFLFLMLPLPQFIHNAVMLPLQNLATTSAVFCLEMMGYAVIREGNIIHLNDTAVAVAEACNGLRMVMAFFVIISLVIMLVQRQWWEKLVVLISSLFIALLCNTVRLTITAAIFTVFGAEKWEAVFHDFGGYAMMPLALGVVIFELWLLTKLFPMPQVPKWQIVNRKSGN